MTAKRPPWLVIWARYLLVLLIVGVIALCRRPVPALRALGGALSVIGSLPFKMFDAFANRRLDCLAFATARNAQDKALLVGMAQQQAMLQNAYMKPLQAQVSMSNECLAMLMNQPNPMQAALGQALGACNPYTAYALTGFQGQHPGSGGNLSPLGTLHVYNSPPRGIY